jgi:phosphoglycolate phosphatase
MNRFEAVIFDWNGTLIDDAWLSVKAMNRMLEKRGKLPITIDLYSRIFEFPVINYYKELDLDVENEWEEISMEFIENYLAEMSAVKLFDDVKIFLNYLKENSIERGILSAMKHEWLNGHVQKLGINDYFSFIQGVEDHYGEGKTHLARNILEKLDISPEKILFIGDTVHDLEVSKAAGFKTILVPRGHNSLERLEKSGATVISSFKEIISFIESEK